MFFLSAVLESTGLSEEEQKCQQDPILVFQSLETPVSLATANQLTSFNYMVVVFEVYIVGIILYIWYAF